jgi:hypothetical protein
LAIQGGELFAAAAVLADALFYDAIVHVAGGAAYTANRLFDAGNNLRDCTTAGIDVRLSRTIPQLVNFGAKTSHAVKGLGARALGIHDLGDGAKLAAADLELPYTAQLVDDCRGPVRVVRDGPRVDRLTGSKQVTPDDLAVCIVGERGIADITLDDAGKQVMDVNRCTPLFPIDIRSGRAVRAYDTGLVSILVIAISRLRAVRQGDR